MTLTIAGCGLLEGDNQSADGRYVFENSYGYTEKVVVRPDYRREVTFRVMGQLEIADNDGSLAGQGSCTRVAISREFPAGTVETTESTKDASLTGERDGTQLSAIRISGCAFPRVMFGELDGGRIILDTDLGFPVSRGTTVISERTGDPSRLVLRLNGDPR